MTPTNQVVRWSLAAVVLLSMVSPIDPLFDLPWVLKLGLVAALVVPRPEPVLVSVALCTWALLKLWGLHASATDDNIYFYLAHRWSEGALPYRDFFFAHPPVHLAVLALVFKLVGFSLVAAKAVPALAQTVAMLAFWRVARSVDVTAGLAVLCLSVVSAELLESSATSNGQDVMAMFAGLSLLALMKRRPALAGALSGLSLGAALYGVGAVLPLGLMALREGRKSALRFGAGVGGAVVSWSAAGLLLGGDRFIDSVFRYHTVKRSNAGQWSPFSGPEGPFSAFIHNMGIVFDDDPTLSRLVLRHTAWVVLLMVGLGWVAVQRPNLKKLEVRSLEGLVLLGATGAGLSTLMLGGLTRVFSFYLVPLVLWLTLGAGASVALLGRALLEPSRRWAAVAALTLCLLHLPWAQSLTSSNYPDEKTNAGATITFRWLPPEVLPSLGEVQRRLFFSERRIKGEVLPGWRSHFMKQLQRFSTATELAAYLEANTTPAQTLIGSSTHAPLVALLAHRRLAGDEADTNSMRFTSGTFTDAALWQRACADDVTYVLGAPRSHFDERGLQAMATVRAQFTVERVFHDTQLLHTQPVTLTLLRRTSPTCTPLD